MEISKDKEVLDILTKTVVGAAIAFGGTFHVNIKGGEVTMNPHNLEIFKSWYEQAPNISYSLITNGIRLTKSWIDFLKISSRGTGIQVSLNGYNAETHMTRMRVPNAWKAAVNTVHELLKAQLSTTVSFVMSPKTILEHYVIKILDFVEEEFSDEEKSRLTVIFNKNDTNPDYSDEEVFSKHPQDELLIQAIKEDVNALVSTHKDRKIKVPFSDISAIVGLIKMEKEQTKEILNTISILSNDAKRSWVLSFDRYNCPFLQNIYFEYSQEGNIWSFICCENREYLGDLTKDSLESIFTNKKEIVRSFTQKQVIHKACGPSCFVVNILQERGWKYEEK